MALDAAPVIAYRGFSHPGERAEEAWLSSLVATHAIEYWRVFVAHYEEVLRASTYGLVEVINASLDRLTCFDLFWDPAFGQCRKLLASERTMDHDPAAAAVSIGLRLVEFGAEGEWKASLRQPVSFHFHNYRLPTTSRICVSSDHADTTITLDDDQRAGQYKFVRRADGWSNSQLEQFPVVSIGGHGLMISNGEGHAEMATCAVAECLRASVNILQSCGEDYTDWVSRAIRRIEMLRGSLTDYHSMSNADSPSVAWISFPCSPITLGEMLVHEASHQHFFLLSRLGPVDDGTDTTLYYSPIKETSRPLRMILLAYHAFANVLLFYRRLKETGADDGYSRFNEEQLVREVTQLEQPLRATSALTSIGHALWRPISGKLQCEQ